MSGQEFLERMNSSSMRHAYQLGYSIELASRIASEYNDSIDSGQDLLSHTMLDAFYVHIRLLAEFLVRKTPAMDFGPKDFGVEWNFEDASASEEGQHMLQHWKNSSTYVVHYGRARVPDNLVDLREFDVSGAGFKAMAKDALVLMGKFISALRAVEMELEVPLVPSPAETLYSDFRRASSRLNLEFLEPSA